jgi:hypothetical protein
MDPAFNVFAKGSILAPQADNKLNGSAQNSRGIMATPL